MAGAEDFRLRVDHSVQQSHWGIVSEVRQTETMSGKLFVGFDDSDSKVTKAMSDLCASQAAYNPTTTALPNAAATSKAPCYLDPPKDADGVDVFPVSWLLAAANVSLDGMSYGNAHSQRFNGLTVIASIEYSNYHPFSGQSETISYVYRLNALTASAYSKTQIISSVASNATARDDLDELIKSRVVLEHSGVFFFFTQAGLLGGSDFSTLLTTLTSSLTLLAVATTVVNYLALYVMKNKHYYNNIMYEWSIDFSDLEDSHLAEKDLPELQRMCIELGMRQAGTKEDLVMRILKEQTSREDERRVTVGGSRGSNGDVNEYMAAVAARGGDSKKQQLLERA